MRVGLAVGLVVVGDGVGAGVGRAVGALGRGEGGLVGIGVGWGTGTPDDNCHDCPKSALTLIGPPRIAMATILPVPVMASAPLELTAPGTVKLLFQLAPVSVETYR